MKTGVNFGLDSFIFAQMDVTGTETWLNYIRSEEQYSIIVSSRFIEK